MNLRPVEILPGLEPPLRGKTSEDVRMLFVRENTEGEYCGVGGRFKRGTPDEFAIQQSIFTRKGVERVMRYAFELARQRPRRLSGERHEVERHAVHHGVVGRNPAGGRGGLSGGERLQLPR